MGYQGNIHATVPLAFPQCTELDGDWLDSLDPGLGGQGPGGRGPDDGGPDTTGWIHNVLWDMHGGQLSAGQAAGLVAAVLALGWAATLLG